MLFYCRKPVAAGVCFLLAAALLFFFSDRLLFSFQVWRLRGLDCDIVMQAGPAGSAAPSGLCRKLWAHRVNSGERFKKLGKQFAGLETDAVFDAASGKFDVHHPPGPPSGLLLDSFLSQLSGTGLQLWIDLKDLHTGDIPAAVEALRECDRRYGIREHILVESSLPEFVSLLAEEGFSTSFLVPDRYLGEAGPGGQEGSRNEGEGIPAPVLSPRVAYVSQDVRYLGKLKELYPGRRIITWSLSIGNYIDRSGLRSLIADTAVAVVLVNVKSRPYR